MDYNVIEIANGYLLEPQNTYIAKYMYNFMYFSNHVELLDYIKKVFEEEE